MGSGDQWRATIQHALPFGTVLTLPATGSEMNKGSVITREELHAKLAFMVTKFSLNFLF